MDEIFAAIDAYAETEGVDAEKLTALADACAAIVEKDPDSAETMALLDAVLALIATDDAEEVAEETTTTTEETV